MTEDKTVVTARTCEGIQPGGALQRVVAWAAGQAVPAAGAYQVLARAAATAVAHHRDIRGRKLRRAFQRRDEHSRGAAETIGVVPDIAAERVVDHAVRAVVAGAGARRRVEPRVAR